jgi:hypothetical protein
MIKVWKWKVGVFFNKTGDFETYTNQKGIRISFINKNEFWDIYLYPKIFIYKCKW